MIDILLPTAVFLHGLAAGVMLGNAIGPGEFARELSYREYVGLIKYMWPRYDPLLPIMNGAAFAGYVVAAIIARGALTESTLAAAAVLLGVLMIISVTKNVPINRYVTGLDPARQPADWPDRDPRTVWARWNHLRVTLSLAAFVLGVIATAHLLTNR